MIEASPTVEGGTPIWQLVDERGEVVQEARIKYDTTTLSETYSTHFSETENKHVITITAPEPRYHDNADYYSWELDDRVRAFREDLRDFSQLVSEGLAARRAMFLAWNKEAQTAQFKALLTKETPPEHKLQRMCYGRERMKMPVRERFKKRVCGGHQRYRVMKP